MIVRVKEPEEDKNVRVDAIPPLKVKCGNILADKVDRCVKKVNLA